MGMLDSMVGGDSGNNGGAGLNYNADAAKLILPVNEDQQKQDYQKTLDALDQQSKFIAATAAQNGLSNQASAYNQLQNYANGQGPNPAQAQLQLATGQNSANLAATMASQRGASSNPALIARMAAQQGGANQQNAAGQAAALQAQQSANALQQLGGLATTEVGQQANAINSYTQGAQNQNQANLNAIGQYNQAQAASTASQNSANSGVSQIAAKGQQDLVGGIFKGAASAAAAAHGGQIDKDAQGRPTVNRYATGGPVIQAPDMNTAGAVSAAPSQPTAAGPRSGVGKFLNATGDTMGGTPQQQQQSGAFGAGEAIGKGLGTAFGSLFGSSSTPQEAPSSSSAFDDMTAAMNSTPGADNSSMTDMVASMGMADGGSPQDLIPMLMKLAPMLAARNGAIVPGKASVKGDSLKNDKVPAILSPKEIVLPRSVTMAEDAPERAAEFVRQILSGKHKKKK